MYFLFCFPKTGQKKAVSHPWAFRVCSLEWTLWPGLSVVGRGQGNPGSWRMATRPGMQVTLVGHGQAGLEGQRGAGAFSTFPK